LGYNDDNGNLYLDEREPLRFRDEPDNRFHTVKDGDTLWGLADLNFSKYKRPAGLWWIIAEFQPTPIVDPTIRLKAGSTIVIPSERLVSTRVFNEENRRYH
jgi:hypothetical protein